MEIKKTICGMCGNDCCGLDVYVENGRVVDVKGSGENPVNAGKLCPQGRAALELEQHPQRLSYPLRRSGSGWERISWDQALDIIAAKLTRIKGRYGAHSLVVYEGEPLLQYMRDGWSRRFMNLYGTPNWAQHDHMCYLPSVIAQKLTYGSEEVDGFEPDFTRCVFLWGANPVTSHLTSHWRNWSIARKRGAKLIVVDPRFTQAAAQADIYVPVRPGSDIALALGLINVILTERLYDADFVGRWATGLEPLAERVRPFTPERVAALTGVEKDLIAQVAETYASNRPGWLDAGNALEHHSNSGQTLRALAILRTLTDNIDVPGGHLLVDELPLADMRLQDRLPTGLRPLGAAKYPLFVEFAGFIPGDVLTETLNSDQPYPIKAMLLGGGNPALTWPNSQRVRTGLERLDLFVVMELFMTATARMADIVLPAAAPFERTQLIANAGPFGVDEPTWYLGLRKQIVDPGERRSDWWFWNQLAHRMGYGADFPWSRVEDAIADQLKPLGLSVTDLEANPGGLLYGDPPSYRRYETEGFRTPTGKVELYSHVLASYGHDPLPHYEEPHESVARAPETAKRYPLILNAGRRVSVYTHSRHRNLPSLRRKQPEPLAELHPTTAAAYGIADGDWIVVESPRGSIEIKALVTKDIVPDTVGLVHGWEEANPNLLTDHRDCDPVFATPSLRAGLCAIKRRGDSHG